MSAQQPLSGLRVVELYAIGPVPFAGLQLHRLGASVTRICPVQERGIGIVMQADTDLLNRNKTHLALDLKQADSLARLHELLADADVLIEGFRPGVMERLGLACETLTSLYPSLVIGRLSGFGRHGPYAKRAGHDINYLALSGALAAIGKPESPSIPLNLIADFGGGAMHLLVGILAKLVQRGINGTGGVVDTSILGGTLGLTPMMHSLLEAGQWTLARESNLLDGGLPFYRVYKTADEKFVAVGALELKFFKHLLTLTDLHGVIDANDHGKRRTWPAMASAFTDAFATHDRAYWSDKAAQLDCCVTPVLDFNESLRDEHNIANHWITQTPFPHPGHALQFS